MSPSILLIFTRRSSIPLILQRSNGLRSPLLDLLDVIPRSPSYTRRLRYDVFTTPGSSSSLPLSPGTPDIFVRWIQLRSITISS
ncbi:unnamed protein product [Caenorhabditis nigoni]